MRKFLAIILAAFMVVGTMPLEVFAEEDQGVEVTGADVLSEEEINTPSEETENELTEEITNDGTRFEGEPAELPEDKLNSEEEPDPNENILTPENFVEGYNPENPEEGDWSFYDFLYYSFTYDDELGEYSGIITREEADAITQLYAENWGITTLKGISLFTNLESIDFQNNFMTDIDDLDPSKLTKLTSITFWNCNLTGEVDLSGFTGLEYLDVDGNKISSLNLKNCSNLETLYASYNGLTYVNLKKCSALKTLNLNDNCLILIDLSDCMNLENYNYYNQYPVFEGNAWYTENQYGSRVFMIDFSQISPDVTMEKLVDGGIVTFNYTESITGNLVCGYYGGTENNGTAECTVELYSTTFRDEETMTVYLNVKAEKFDFGFAQDYILMNQGDTFKLETQVPAALGDLVCCEAYKYDTETFGEEGQEYEEYNYSGTDLITVDEDNVISADNPGTFFLEYTLGQWLIYDEDNGYKFFNGYSDKYRVRVDVAANTVEQDVICASLPEKTAAVELYKTDYTSFDFILEREEILSAGAEITSQTVEPDEGVSVTGARFADPAVADLFSLRVDDDRTLQIIPSEKALESGKAGKYSSKIIIELEGRELDPTAEILTFTVKTTQPKLKAAAVKFNSFTYDNFIPEAELNITGGQVTGIEAVSAPDWIDVLSDAMTLRYVGASERKVSTKLQLMCTVEGYCVKIPVTVAVSASSTAPVIKLAEKIPSLSSNNDQATVSLSINIPEFAKTAYVSKITEGKNIVDYEDNKLNAWTGYSDGYLYLSLETMGADDGKDHTYKVYVYCFGKEFSYTVKVTSASKKAPYITASLSGAIDLSVPNSYVTASIKCMNYNNYLYGSDNILYDVYDATSDEMVTEYFNCCCMGYSEYTATPVIRISVNDVSSVNPKHTYKLYLYRSYGYDEDYEALDTAGLKAAVKLNIKSSDKSKVQPALTAKVSGKADSLTGSCITASFQFKNLNFDPTDFWDVFNDETSRPFYAKVYKTYDAETKKTLAVSDENLIYDSAAEENDYRFSGWFDADQNFNVAFYLYCNECFNTKDKFALVLGYDDGSTSISAKPVSFSVSRSKVKVNLDAGSSIMYVNDNEAVLNLKFSSPSLSWCSADDIILTGNPDNMFELVQTDWGEYSLCWKDGSIPAAAKKYAGKTVNVKMNVYLNNNYCGLLSPDSTVTLKVNIR